jgi:hypothetical protein
MKPGSFAALLMGAIGLAALSGGKHEAKVSMHPDDWLGLKEGDSHRRYRSWRQASHHLKELARLAPQLAEVYLRRSISPAFREEIMLVTATCNDCAG